jgi:hypothetical protein
MHDEYLPGYDWEEILEKNIDSSIFPENPVITDDDLTPPLEQNDSDGFF